MPPAMINRIRRPCSKSRLPVRATQYATAARPAPYNPGMEERMRANPKDDPVLKRFCAALGEAYGDRLERVVLFGSRARGDHRPDSDYDIAGFIRKPGHPWEKVGTLAGIPTDSLVQTGADVSAK